MVPRFRDRRAVAGRAASSRLQLQRALVSAVLGDGAPAALGGGDESIGGGSPLLRWWRPGIRDAVADTLRPLPGQRGQSRELARLNSIAAGAVNTVVDRAVGTGLALVAAPDRRVLGWDADRAIEYRAKVQAEFSLFADSPASDLECQLDFYGKQELTLRAALESGDCFTVLPDDAPSAQLPYRLRLQTIEADRVGNPGNGADSEAIAGGIRRDSVGRPEACHVYDHHPGAPIVSGNRWAGRWIEFTGRSGRRRILHHFRPLRPGQPRGVPYLAPVINELKQIGRYSEAEIQAAVISAFLTVFIETDAATGPAPVFGVTPAAAAQDPEVKLGPGAVIGLARGEKANAVRPERPSQAFAPFIEAVTTHIGMALGLPVELLIKRFQSSYSASRAALLDAWVFLRGRRAWLAKSFCQPVYETWFAEAVASGRIEAPGFFADPLLRWAYTRAEWHGDSMGSLNPKDEVTAYLDAIDGRLMTRERAEWELFGTDWHATLDEKRVEQQRLKEAELLPSPRAGAAARPPAEPAPGEKALVDLAAEVRAQLTALSGREAPAPVINITTPPVEVHAGDVHVTTPPVQVEGHEINVTLPEGCIQLDATLQAPAPPQVTVPVRIETPAPQVVVQQAARPPVRHLHRRDSAGNLIETIVEPLTH